MGKAMKIGCYRDIEFCPPEEARKIQDKLLREHVAYCAGQSLFYRTALEGAAPDDISVDTITSLPFTDKADLEARNDDFLAVSASKIVDVVQSSGTTGKPTRVMYTESDLQRLAYNEEQSFAACGLTADDSVLLTCTIDRCFVAGLAYFLGIRALGAAAIRNGHGSMPSHLSVIQRMKPTGIVGVPSFLRKLGEFLQGEGVDPAETPVERLVCIGEPLRDRDMNFLKLGSDLERIWAAKVFSTYASSEMVTTFCECTAQQGGHLHADLAIVETVDDDGNAVPDGSAGEVVVTPLVVEGMPLIRFRTGDVSFLMREKCPCGRLSPRLGPIIGRKKQMMKVRGTTLYPQAVYSALDEMPEVSEYYIIVDSEDDLSDQVTIHVAVRDGTCSADTVAEALQARLRVKPGVVVEPEETVRQYVYSPKSRKPIRFTDNRSHSW